MENSKQTKLTDDELLKFKEISNVYQEVIMEMGQLHIDKIELEKTIEKFREREIKLNQLYQDTKVSEKNHIDSILQKYGEGNISLKDGTFTKL